MSGKHYKKSVRTHKLSFQALWRLLHPHLIDYFRKHDPIFPADTGHLIDQEKHYNLDELIAMLSRDQFHDMLTSFIQENEATAIVSFWWQYMEIVAILLRFTRAQRDGLCDLHLSTFCSMLSYFMRYDHPNYARWSPVYMADMLSLLESVLQEFREDNLSREMTPNSTRCRQIRVKNG